MCKTVEALSLLLVEQKVNPSLTLRAVETLLREAIAENQPKTTELSHERLLEVLHYDRETGHFYWRGGRCRGMQAGCVSVGIRSDGYRIIKIDGVNHRAARLARFYCDGVWPEGEVDHINKIKDDDRIANLRVADRYTQGRNMRLDKNPWGTPGVVKLASGKYKVQISENGKRIYGGIFGDQYEAVKACKALRKAHGVELG